MSDIVNFRAAFFSTPAISQTRPMRRKAGVRLFDQLSAEPKPISKAIYFFFVIGMLWHTIKGSALIRLGKHMEISALHHVQLAMPKGQEKVALAFYQGLLGLRQAQKPPILAARGGLWFERGTVRVHLGIEADFVPAKKAHPAFKVNGVVEMLAHLEACGVPVTRDENLPGFVRGYVEDPFGNRIELLEPISGG